MRSALAMTYPEEPVGQLLHVLTPDSVANLPGLPPYLGVKAFTDLGAELPANCLVAQAQALKNGQPGRRHFRLLLINAFGANLGDNLIGLAAFRHVLVVLRKYFPVVTVDVLLGWHSNDRLSRLFRDMDEIDTIRIQGLTLAELGRYQALFDTSNLIDLPQYGKLAMVDWYLWWMGLDPLCTPVEEKRNAVVIPEAERNFVATLLPPGTGPLFLFNPQASVPLRSMPEKIIPLMLETILAAWPEAMVVLLGATQVKHPRLVNLSGKITDVDRLAALVAAVDALVGVDTYTTHLADAVSTPAVTIYSSITPERYPYYPLDKALLLPNAEKLPAWGKGKASAEIWADMTGTYDAAWQALEPEAVIAALKYVIQKKAAGVFPQRLLTARKAAPMACPTRLLPDGVLEVPLRQHDDPMARLFDETVARVAEQIVRSGDTVALLGAGAGESSLALARLIGRDGHMVTFEPRRHLHQLLCANLTRAGIWHVETHLVMPEGENLTRREINGLQAADEYGPLMMANGEQPESVVCWPFDLLALDACRLLVLRSPLARLPILEGTRDTLTRLRPVVLLGVLSMHNTPVFESFLSGLNYRVRVLLLGTPDEPEHTARCGIILAEPM
ncbi:MAG: glycosyltransferase family 9 protein [Desulfurivibrionaceae bacterium]